MPTPKQLANLKPGVGRPPRDTSQVNITLPKTLLANITRIAQQQSWSKSYTIEVYLKKSLDLLEIDGHSIDHLNAIAKDALNPTPPTINQ